MNDREFEQEIESLLRAERKKEPYYLESVEKEQLEVVAAFYDHYASLSEMRGVSTVEDFLSTLELPDSDDDQAEANEDLIAELHELTQKDVERFPVLLGGEVMMKGEGLFMYDADPQGETEDQSRVMEVDEIEEGVTVTGEVRHYVIAPMIPYETFVRWQSADSYEDMEADDMANEAPGLWLSLSDVTVSDASGAEIKTLDNVLVPMNYPSMKLNKIIRQSISAERLAPQEETKAPVITHFKGDFITGVFNDKENDLNYNDYSEEELRAAREAHQLEIGIYMSAVESDAELVLTAFNSIGVEGNEEGFAGKTVRYIDSAFMKPRNEWRVVHAFLVDVEDGVALRHVLSEDIITIHRKDEK